MYLSHYNLNIQPFQISPDPKFLWLGEIHKEALAILKYGILGTGGFIILVGDVGTGKTTLINGLIDSLAEDAVFATILDPRLEKLDFYNFLANTFKLNKKFSNKGDFLVHFIHFLHRAYAENKKVLLIIDEAQRLTNEMLEDLRLLSNIEKRGARLLNIVLFGQNELNETLAEKNNRALLQKITIRYSIAPLKNNEVWDYIKFRLSIAGSTRNIFNSGAIREIISFSKCNPRMINNICDHALLAGYFNGINKIDDKIVKECAKKLQAPEESEIEKEETDRNIGKTTIYTLKNIWGKPAWWMPVFITLFVLFLIAGGYYYFPDRYDKISGTNNQIENMASESLQVSLKGEKKSASEEKTKNALSFPDQKLTINFPLSSNDFSDEAYELLDRFAETIFQTPDAEIIIKGYTDTSGSESYNLSLSIFRANVVKSYFVGQGINPAKIKSFGMGSENPIESNATIQGRKANRRIEIELKTNKS